MQFSFLYGGVFVAITPLLAFAAFCYMFGAFVSDIQRSLTDLNENIEKKYPLGTVTSAQLKKQLCNIIEFHCITKQFVAFHFSFRFYLVFWWELIRQQMFFSTQIHRPSWDDISCSVDSLFHNVDDGHLLCSFELEWGIFYYFMKLMLVNNVRKFICRQWIVVVMLI